MSNLESQPVEQWVQYAPDGNVALCDPFTGIPLRGHDFSREPNRPPVNFKTDPELRDGYALWQDGMRATEGDLQIGVFLADPHDPNGLGDIDTFRFDVLPHFDVVGYATTRSVLRAEKRRREQVAAGQTALMDMLGPDEQFISNLLALAGERHMETFPIDPPTTRWDSFIPEGPTAEGLQTVRDAVAPLAFGERDLDDVSMQFAAPDIIYTNTLQWHQLPTGGQQIRTIMRNRELSIDLMPNVLLVVPPECHDIARKVGALINSHSGENVTTVAADPAARAAAWDYEAYTVSMQEGILDPRLLQQ